MNTFSIHHASGEYTVYVGKNILQQALRAALSTANYDRVYVVSDTNVWELWSDTMKAALDELGIKPAGVSVFLAGEKSKTLETVSHLYAGFSAANLTRRSLIIAFGGGVCGDMAGFAAATYLRGIDVMQVPTTLLSQIDSSLGGKTGVDLSVGKNLVGAFWQPMAVIADSRFLDTLPERYLRDGMGEAIKYGCIADAALFDGIADQTIERSEMIYRCMKIKAGVVEEDEFEQGVRAILNYGHTLGHAVEKLGNFEAFSHGEAVGIGMLYAAKIGAALGYDSHIEAKIRTALEVWKMPTEAAFSADALMKVVASDKKRAADEIRFILLEKIGKAVIRTVSLKALGEFV